MSTTSYQLLQLVRLKDLNNAPYNGKLARVAYFPSFKLCCNGRYRIQLIDEVAPPLLSELSVKPENMEHVCIRCHKGGEKLLLCGKCRYALYCDRECQRIDWGRHIEECRNCSHARDASKNPLYLAVEAGDLGQVQKLVREGIDVNITTNTTNTTALYIAALRNNFPIVQYLLQHGADKDKVNNEGVGPLFIAAQMGHLAVVKCLVEQGASKDKANSTGASPLFVASQEGHLAVVQ